jgi:hypothetical protein
MLFPGEYSGYGIDPAISEPTIAATRYCSYNAVIRVYDEQERKYVDAVIWLEALDNIFGTQRSPAKFIKPKKILSIKVLSHSY